MRTQYIVRLTSDIAFVVPASSSSHIAKTSCFKVFDGEPAIATVRICAVVCGIGRKSAVASIAATPEFVAHDGRRHTLRERVRSSLSSVFDLIL